MLTWTVFVAKSLELAAAARRQRGTLAAVERAASLANAPARRPRRRRPGRAEAVAGRGAGPRGPEGARRLAAGTARGWRRPAHAQGYRTCSPPSAPPRPFVGLFGTVWGIMKRLYRQSRARIPQSRGWWRPASPKRFWRRRSGWRGHPRRGDLQSLSPAGSRAYRALVGDTSAAVLRLVSRDLGRQPCR